MSFMWYYGMCMRCLCGVCVYNVSMCVWYEYDVCGMHVCMGCICICDLSVCGVCIVCTYVILCECNVFSDDM